MTEKRFTIIYNEHSEMMQYVDNQKEEPNRWAIWNASETAQKLNELNDKNEQLKHQNNNLVNMIARVQYRADLIKEENEKLKTQLKELQEFKDNYDKNMELIHNSEYVQDFLNGNI